MAYVKPMLNADGDITSYRVRWRKGGARKAPGESERFDPDEAGLEAAELFCAAVNEAGQNWPAGWVKGRGMIAPDVADESEYRFDQYAAESVNHRTGVEDRYRDACHGELARYMNPTFGNCEGSKHKLMSPKTIKNLHGLLSSILQEAVEADPPLRDRNPCKGVRLPRTDDDGTTGDDVDEDIEFMTPQEVAGIASCMRTPQGKRLTEDIYETGSCWGEASAWASRHLDQTDLAKPRARVVRAWKWSRTKGHYLGKPNSKRSRRSIRITLHTRDNWVAQGVQTRGPDALIYHNGQGERLPYSTFYDEWMDAVGKAKERGLLPEHKNPTIHDLRHSHAAGLISAGHSVTYVQRRLGHESIKTTSDLYGHLLPETDDAAMNTIDATLDGAPITHVSPPDPAPVPAARQPVTAAAADGATVHVVLFPGGHQEAFWRDDFARLVADVWKLERREEPRIEPRSCIRRCPPARRSGGLGRSSTGPTANSRPVRRTRTSYGPSGRGSGKPTSPPSRLTGTRCTGRHRAPAAAASPAARADRPGSAPSGAAAAYGRRIGN